MWRTQVCRTVCRVATPLAEGFLECRNANSVYSRGFGGHHLPNRLAEPHGFHLFRPHLHRTVASKWNRTVEPLVALNTNDFQFGMTLLFKRSNLQEPEKLQNESQLSVILSRAAYFEVSALVRDSDFVNSVEWRLLAVTPWVRARARLVGAHSTVEKGARARTQGSGKGPCK